MGFVHDSTANRRARPQQLAPERLEDRCVPSASSPFELGAGLNGQELLSDPVFATVTAPGDGAGHRADNHGAAAITGAAGNATAPVVGSNVATVVSTPAGPAGAFSLNHLAQMTTQAASISGAPQNPKPAVIYDNIITVNSTQDKYFLTKGGGAAKTLNFSPYLSLRDAIALVDGSYSWATDVGPNQAKLVGGAARGFFGVADEIVFDNKLFSSGLQTISLTKALPTIDDTLRGKTNIVTITGPGATFLGIDGLKAYNIMSVNQSILTVSGVLFENGFSKYSGAALHSGYQTLVYNCNFVGNRSNGTGGAVFASNASGKATLVLGNDQFNNNKSATGGGALYAGVKNVQIYSTDFTQNYSFGGPGAISVGLNPSNAIISGCTIAKNSSNIGTAAAISGSFNNWSMYDSTVSGTYTTFGGSSRYAVSGAYAIVRSTFYANRYVAAVHLSSGEYLVNDTIAGNIGSFDPKTKQYHGGGIIASGGSIYNCTIVSNNGLGGLDTTGPGVVLTNTIVMSNRKGFGTSNADITGNVNVGKSFNNLIGIGGAGGLTNGTNGNQINKQLNAPGVYLTKLSINFGGPTETMAPYSNSTYVIDRGDTGVVFSHYALFQGVDQNGSPRVFNGIVDIGSVEFNGTNPGPPKPPPGPGPGPQPIPGPPGFPKINGGVFFTDGINQLWMLANDVFTPTGGFALTFSGNVDAAGNPECYFLDGNHEIWRYDNGVFTNLGAFATQISAGRGMLAFLDGNGQLWTFSDSTQNFTNTGAFATQISAGSDAKGKNYVYFLDGSSTLWVINPDGSATDTGGFATSISAARNQSGSSEVYFLDGNRHLWNYDSGSFTPDTGPIGFAFAGSQGQAFFADGNRQVVQWLEGNVGANQTGAFALQFSATPNTNFFFFLDGNHQLWLFYKGEFFNTLAFGVNISTF